MLSEPAPHWLAFATPLTGSATAVGGVSQPLERTAASAKPTIPDVPSHQRKNMLVPIFEELMFSELRAGDGKGLSRAAGCVAVRDRDGDVEGSRLGAGEGRCGGRAADQRAAVRRPGESQHRR